MLIVKVVSLQFVVIRDIGYMTNLRNRIWNGNVANVYNFSVIFKKQFIFYSSRS